MSRMICGCAIFQRKRLNTLNSKNSSVTNNKTILQKENACKSKSEIKVWLGLYIYTLKLEEKSV